MPTHVSSCGILTNTIFLELVEPPLLLAARFILLDEAGFCRSLFPYFYRRTGPLSRFLLSRWVSACGYVRWGNGDFFPVVLYGDVMMPSVRGWGMPYFSPYQLSRFGEWLWRPGCQEPLLPESAEAPFWDLLGPLTALGDGVQVHRTHQLYSPGRCV